MRFNVGSSTIPVLMESSGNGVDAVVDVSRGGVQLSHNNKLQVGDIVPVHIAYGDVDIDADVQVVQTTDHSAGAKFINLDQATANQLLYLNILMEDTINVTE